MPILKVAGEKRAQASKKKTQTIHVVVKKKFISVCASP